ncbi:hypothetical protein GCWU000321_01236 [Dialister invisus DSM 15470]|uniref:Uncharacterized protein n=1 Tax=Dialister invisus DSM 15470 TaxID=592028 RepID=C9LNW2_9FIRM|nr:hypothetical protein GCWU000321_01236 [Dialister invisus DSM 15470]
MMADSCELWVRDKRLKIGDAVCSLLWISAEKDLLPWRGKP